MLANIHSSKKGKKYKYEDFMPNFGGKPTRPQMNPDEMLAKVVELNAKMGGKDLRKKSDG